MAVLPEASQATTQKIESLLLETIRCLYARDMQVTGLLELPVAQIRVLNVLAREPKERRPMGVYGGNIPTPNDRRIVRLGMTDEGRRFLAERRGLRHERLAAVLSQLTLDRRQSLLVSLTPLAEATHRVAWDEAQADSAFSTLLREVR